jgi:2-keto-4-pentenoate hydratase/2-oxohepta-3-ene-1,7-dioic acid hydratase in catechol pathway
MRALSVREERIARIEWNGKVWYARPDGTDLELFAGSPLDGLVAVKERVSMGEVQFLPPVPATKLIGIGANFPGEEPMGHDPYPSFFIKPPSSFTGHLTAIELPHVFRSVVAEGELGVVVGRRCRNLTPDEVPGAILGWTVINDLSGRESTLEVVPPAVKKSADGFAPMGPFMNLDASIRPFTLTTWRNGELVQRGTTESLRFDVVACLVYVSSIMTLEPYDVLALGTPPPKPTLRPGDEVAVEIEGIGRLVNHISLRGACGSSHRDTSLKQGAR